MFTRHNTTLRSSATCTRTLGSPGGLYKFSAKFTIAAAEIGNRPNLYDVYARTYAFLYTSKNCRPCSQIIRFANKNYFSVLHLLLVRFVERNILYKSVTQHSSQYTLSRSLSLSPSLCTRSR